MKLSIRASWEPNRPRRMNTWADPISAVHIAKVKMAIPKDMCQGISVAFAVFSASGKKYVKKPSSHWKKKLKDND